MKDSPPFWTFTSKKKIGKLEEIPGPGAYSPVDVSLSAAPKYRLGTGQRRPLTQENLTPGPGSYSPKLSTTTPSWTLSGKTGRDGFSPRGTAYTSFNTNTISQSPESSQMRTRKLLSAGNPISYSNTKNLSNEKSEIKNSVPGPGVYKIPVVKEGPSFSFRPRFENIVKCPIPGPGQYMPKVELSSRKSPSWIVGKEGKAFNNLNRDVLAVPGPGSYEKVSTLAGPQWTFPSDKRKSSVKSTNPGPGSYKTQAVFANPPPYMNFERTL